MKKFILFCSFFVALLFVIPVQSETVLTNPDQTFLACDQGVPQIQQVYAINCIHVEFDFVSSPPLTTPQKKSNKTKTAKCQESQIIGHYDPGWQLRGLI